MAQLREWIDSHKAAAWTIAGIGGALLTVLVYAGIAVATELPQFCRSACHEMAPYYDEWAQGTHKDVNCAACHVDPGEIARFKHKFVALKEVQSHFTGDTKFPRPEFAVVPNERCLRCHPKVQVNRTGFSHSEHAARGPCMSCHPGVGHSVTIAALRQAGVYSGKPSAVAALETSQVAAVEAGEANLLGHVAVYCSRCHDMMRTGCTGCHQPAPHVARGDCSQCHLPGLKFQFTHPTGRRDCGVTGCHTVPAKHDHPGVCGDCHSFPGKSWKYAHTSRSPACVSCHIRPAKHRAGGCGQCHAKSGVSWAFKHPAASSACNRCHARPARHRSGTCSVCHRTGPKWLFRHPTGSNCPACHLRPRGHRAGACVSCHRRRGVSWAFTHPTSSRCSSCHRAPARHYGSNCSACHSPRRAWRSATFKHPRIPGGEHTSRSFACSNCHPRSKSSYTCAKCHDSSTGPRDD